VHLGKLLAVHFDLIKDANGCDINITTGTNKHKPVHLSKLQAALLFLIKDANGFNINITTETGCL